MQNNDKQVLKIAQYIYNCPILRKIHNETRDLSQNYSSNY